MGHRRRSQARRHHKHTCPPLSVASQRLLSHTGVFHSAAGAKDGEIYTSWLHTCTFLSDVSELDDGGTLVLSGSHRLDAESPDGVIKAGDPLQLPLPPLPPPLLRLPPLPSPLQLPPPPLPPPLGFLESC